LKKKFKGQGTELLPTELKACAIAEQGAYIELQNFDKHAFGLTFQTVFRGFENSRLAELS
jgi:glutathione S-transferase